MKIISHTLSSAAFPFRGKIKILAKPGIFAGFLSLFKIGAKLLPPLALITALDGCTKPGSTHLSYSEAESWISAGITLRKRLCPDLKNITAAEVEAYDNQLIALNSDKKSWFRSTPHPRETFWVRLRGTDLNSPPCPQSAPVLPCKKTETKTINARENLRIEFDTINSTKLLNKLKNTPNKNLKKMENELLRRHINLLISIKNDPLDIAKNKLEEFKIFLEITRRDLNNNKAKQTKRIESKKDKKEYVP